MLVVVVEGVIVIVLVCLFVFVFVFVLVCVFLCVRVGGEVTRALVFIVLIAVVARKIVSPPIHLPPERTRRQTVAVAR